MSVSEDSVPCPTKNSVSVNSLDSASVSDAETVLKNSNVHSCHVEEATSQNDSQFLEGLLTDTFCQVCEAVLMFESQRVSHYEGKRHAQRVRIYLQTKKAERDKQNCKSSSFQNSTTDPEKFCALCNMVFSSPTVAKSHYMGKVHAKNTRKSSVSSLDTRTTLISTAPPLEAVMVTAETQGNVVQKPKEIPVSAAHKVDLSDPDKYCKLCTASFNNPMMASEHYGGRKHQRNLARQEQRSQLGEQSKHANSLNCPVCGLTLSSIDTYQAHMKANKHNINETTQEDAGKKKMYNSFQDELADYIQVQRSRGLEPKTGQLPELQGPQTAGLQSQSHQIRMQHWCPQFYPQVNPAGFRKKIPVPNQWEQDFSSYPPPLIPGLTGRALRRGRSPGSLSSSSSLSDSSSAYSSSSEDSRDRRLQRKKRREEIRKRKTEDNSEEDSQKRKREKREKENPKRQQENFDEDHEKLRKEKKHREKITKKRPREEDEGELTKVSHEDMMKVDREKEAPSEAHKEEKTKHKKEKKKPKDREDNRSEEEKLWDATILGSF